MAQLDKRYARPAAGAQTRAEYDEGLRSHMLGIYNYMALGVALTGLVAYALTMFTTTSIQSEAVAQMGNGILLTSLGKTLYGSPLKWVIMLAPLAFVMILSFGINKLSIGAAQMMFWLFAAVMGVSLSSILLVYTGESVARVFFITAAAFGALSLYGYTTKRDLSGWGSFLIMGVVGIVIAGIVNIWLQSSALQFAISVIGLLAFAGLTAYDTQRLKDEYYAFSADATMLAKSAIMGALSLYLDFINMFMSLLYLFGDRE